jgi:FHA domain
VTDQPTSAPLSTYIRIGAGIGIVSERTLALLEPVNGLLAEDLWQLVESGAGVDDLLERMSSTGLRSLGSFAMAQFEDSGVRVVVRGSGAIEIAGSKKNRQIVASGVRTWVEDFLPGTPDLSLRLGRPAEGELPFRVVHGLVPADLLCRTSTAAGPKLVDLDYQWTEDFVPAPIIGTPPIESVREGTPAASVDALDPQSASSSSVMPTAWSPGTVVEKSSPAAAVEPVAPADAAPATASVPDEVSRVEVDSNLSIGAAEAEAIDESPVAAPVADSQIASIDDSSTISASMLNDAVEAGDLQPSVWMAPNSAPEPADRDYDDYFGRTIARSVQGAIVVVPDESHVELPTAPVGVQAANHAPHSSRAEPDLIVGVPIGAAASESDFDGTDGHTMTKADLVAMRSGVTVAVPTFGAPAMGGPTVQAVMCAANHPSPWGSASCSQCGQAVGASPVVIARPRLGQLRLESGQVIGLDRPLLIGRKPKLEGRMSGEMPQLIELSIGQGLSRTHAMVRYEGWHVLLEDLGSANGTIVTLPGQQPRRLHGSEPALLEYGASIDFGGEVTAVFERNP